jgi:hypothetical protein
MLVRMVSALRYVLILAALAVLFSPAAARPHLRRLHYWTTLPARPGLPTTASPWLFFAGWRFPAPS